MYQELRNKRHKSVGRVKRNMLWQSGLQFRTNWKRGPAPHLWEQMRPEVNQIPKIYWPANCTVFLKFLMHGPSQRNCKTRCQWESFMSYQTWPGSGAKGRLTWCFQNIPTPTPTIEFRVGPPSPSSGSTPTAATVTGRELLESTWFNEHISVPIKYAFCTDTSPLMSHQLWFVFWQYSGYLFDVKRITACNASTH